MTYDEIKKAIDSGKKAKVQVVFDEIKAMFANRLDLRSKKAVQMRYIFQDDIPDRLIPYCTYARGKYRGLYYSNLLSDEFYANINEVYEKLGDDALVYEPSENCAYIEAIYIPEIDCVLIGDIRFSEVYRGKIFYHLVTKDLQVVVEEGNCYDPIKIIKKPGKKKELNNLIVGLDSSIAEMFGLDTAVINTGGNTYNPIRTLADVFSYKSVKDKHLKRDSKPQKKIDELVAKKEFRDCAFENRTPHEVDSMLCRVSVDKVEDGLCVVRWVHNYQNIVFDGLRIYLDDKNVYACKRNNMGEFVPCDIYSLDLHHFEPNVHTPISFNSIDGTRLSWYTSAIENVESIGYRIPILVAMILSPKIEQLVKLGCAEEIQRYLHGAISKADQRICDEIRGNANESNIYRWLGLNKYQFNAILKKNRDKNRPDFVMIEIGQIKKIFNATDISHVDNSVFDPILTAMSRPYRGEIRYMMDEVHGMDDTGVFANNVLRYIDTLNSMGYHGVNLYKDLIHMVNLMGIRREVKLFPKDEYALTITHDSVTAVFNMTSNEVRNENFAKQAAQSCAFEYEGDDFCIKAPTNPNELIFEGVELHHCVKSYIDRVTDGKTNILFVRKINDLSTPFFTVELDNDHVIRQVHGLNNRNASTEPNLTEFVHEWADAKNLTVGNINCVR